MHIDREYPYDYFDAMERLRDCAADMDADERNRLKTIVALNAASPRDVALFVDIAGEDWLHIYPPAPKVEKISTNKAIDTFLDTYGKPSPQEEALIEKLIFNPVPEYAGVLAAEDKEDIPLNDAEGSELTQLANVINGNPPDDKTPNPAPQPPMTFELAKIFIRQGHFERAYDIILKISLNNPEKSAYFADQLRFLEKLIKIQKAKKNDNN
ncbi:MAG: hypothetical protein J1F20_03940 [Muribaculaceae bacterium]|nr:hypothetical protein [Muribaculaceae bacterium]